MIQQTNPSPIFQEREVSLQTRAGKPVVAIVQPVTGAKIEFPDAHSIEQAEQLANFPKEGLVA